MFYVDYNGCIIISHSCLLCAQNKFLLKKLTVLALKPQSMNFIAAMFNDTRKKLKEYIYHGNSRARVPDQSVSLFLARAFPFIFFPGSGYITWSIGVSNSYTMGETLSLECEFCYFTDPS